MATTAREGGVGGGGGGVGGGGGGGRRGNTTSTTQTKPKPSTKPSTSQTKPPLTSSSSSSQKPLPNYLKPTISSSLDPSSSTSSRTARRSNTFSNSASAPTATKPPTPVTRRRSFEKPPSTINPPKALLRGPTNNTTIINTNTRDVVKTVARSTLSSSTSVKSALPPPAKPAPQRSFSSLSSRSTKAAAAPSVKRSLSAKAAPSNSSTGPNVRKVVKKTAPKSFESDSSAELEARDKDPLDHHMAGEGQEEEDHEVQSLHDISEMPGHEEQLGDPVMIEDRENATEKQSVEDAHESDEEPAVTEESVEPADHDENEEKGTSEGATEEDSTKVEEKHVVVVLEGSSGEGSKEGEERKAAAAGEVSEPESPATAKQPYNDVIEETASKLMEKRNKVRALAGAFETVISLDSQ